MYKLLFSTMTLLLALAACKPKSTTQGANSTNFANEKDYICGMTVQANWTDTCHYQGKVYAFCNVSCKEAFQVDPESYLDKEMGPKDSVADSILLTTMPDTVTNENHAGIMDAILGNPKHNIKNIGILVYDGVNDLDFMGPRYILGQSGARVQLVALKPGNFKTVMGVEIVPNSVIDSVNQLDILIIPGGFKGTIEGVYNSKLHDWIRKIDQNTTYTASICTGGWILGATGLLKGKRASTNWYKEEDFLTKYGALPANERYTQDGKYWTSAGVTAGMDMSLAILKENWGEKYAQGVMLDMEYDPAPPLEGGSPEKTGRLVRWMMKSMYDAGINPLIDSLERLHPPSK